MTQKPKYAFPESYSLLKKLGEGGTAEVFLANKKGLAMPIALKVFCDPEHGYLIAKELDIAENINFPGIVRVFSRDMTQCGFPFITMEYCPGLTLESCAGKLSEPQFLSLLSAITVSLNVFHAAGFIHNDLKPANIYCPPGMSIDDFNYHSQYYVKLSDFSLARKLHADSARTITGTVGFMSPEMIQKQTLTPKSDLFSLGVMAYFLACGTMPFTSETDDPMEINARVTEGERPDLRGLGASFRVEVQDLVRQLMAISTEDRPESAFYLLELLSKCGSPYPFRMAVAPRHLLSLRNKLDKAALAEKFGPDSFPPKRLDFLEHTTIFDPVAVRLILEHNFSQGHFARLNGTWGWANGVTEQIAWPSELSRLCLRMIRGTSVTFKKFAMMVSLLSNEAFHSIIAQSLSEVPDDVLSIWESLPSARRPALLESLRRTMGCRARSILSRRLHRILIDEDAPPDVMGKLLFDSADYAKAIAMLMKAVESSNISYSRDKLFELLDLADQACLHINDIGARARVAYKRAMIEKEAGLFAKAEASFYAAIELLRNTEKIELAAQGYKMLGDLYKEKSDYESGIRVLQQARELYSQSENQLGLSQTLNNLGNIYWIAGRLDKSLEHYSEALKIQRELHSEKEIASSLSNIGSINVILGNLDAGVKVLQESLFIKERLGDKGEIARSWNNLGVAYQLLGRIPEALQAYENSLTLNIEIGVKVEQLLNYENLAEISIQAGRVSDALNFLKHAGALATELGDKSHQSSVSRLTGLLLRRTGQFDNAEQYLKESLETAEQSGNPFSILPCHIDLAKLYRDAKDSKLFTTYYTLARQKAEDLGDKAALFALALLRFAYYEDEANWLDAKQLVTELNTSREISLLALTRLEFCIEKNELDEADELVEDIRSYFTDGIEDIELPRIHLVLGKLQLLRQNVALAREELGKSLALSQAANLMPEQWQSQCELSEIAFTDKEFEVSFKYARQAIEVLKKIAAGISNTDRMHRLYSDKKVIQLLGRIKSLQAVLGKIKGAAEAAPHSETIN